tara:strand:- start:52 stop:468 length:417 start_codon:yes stop_codon:yes gene_type:complete
MSFGQPNYNVFNPPDYWTQMVNDPSQVPVQLYPYGGGGGYSPYGPYPGFYMGSRTMTYEEARRHARERERAMKWRAEHSQDPSHKYLNPEGNLNPQTVALIRRAEAGQKRRPEDPVKKIQKRLMVTVLIGAVLSALLK